MAIDRQSTNQLLIRPARQTGWGLPLNGFQITSWVFLVFISLVFFGVILPSLHFKERVIVYSISIFLMTIFVGSLIATTSLDPKDPNVEYHKGNRNARLDRSKRKHVIQNNECYFCQVIVGDRSKHCGICNKCVSDFDHHCKWMNTCVGSRNYKLFISTLVSGVCVTLVCVVISVYVVIVNFSNRSQLRTSGDDYPAFGTTIDRNAFISLAILVALLSAIVFGLIVHLLQFHIMLMMRGIGTYDYIKIQRAKAAGDPLPPHPKTGHQIKDKKKSGSRRKRSWCCEKPNRVAPEQQTNDVESAPGMVQPEQEAMTPGPKQTAAFAWPETTVLPQIAEASPNLGVRRKLDLGRDAAESSNPDELREIPVGSTESSQLIQAYNDSAKAAPTPPPRNLRLNPLPLSLPGLASTEWQQETSF